MDPQAKIKMSYIDMAIDNVRDLMKHVKKERIKTQSILAVNFSDRMFGDKRGGEESNEVARPFNRLTEEEKAF